MRVLLDTNAYSALRRGHPELAGLVRHSQEVLLSTVVAGELLDMGSGAGAGSRATSRSSRSSPPMRSSGSFR